MGFRAVTLQQLQRFAAEPTVATVRRSAAFLAGESGLPGRARAAASASAPDALSGLEACSQLAQSWQVAADSTAGLQMDDCGRFAEELGQVHQELEDALRRFTFEAKAAYEKGDGWVRRRPAQELMQSNYGTILAWRTMVGQHRAAAAAVTGEEHGAEQVADRLIAPLCELAAADARAFTVEKYGVAPEVEVSGACEANATCVGGRVHYMVLEILKNSFRAMIDKYGALDVDEAPPVQITVGASNSLAGIAIVDTGGGMDERQIERSRLFFGSTAPAAQMDYTYSRNFGHTYSGLGFGVPMVDLNARFMGGRLDVMSVPGYSSHAFIRFSRLGTNSW